MNYRNHSRVGDPKLIFFYPDPNFLLVLDPNPTLLAKVPDPFLDPALNINSFFTMLTLLKAFSWYLKAYRF
jgi:hypothetical protein